MSELNWKKKLFYYHDLRWFIFSAEKYDLVLPTPVDHGKPFHLYGYYFVIDCCRQKWVEYKKYSYNCFLLLPQYVFEFIIYSLILYYWRSNFLFSKLNTFSDLLSVRLVLFLLSVSFKMISKIAVLILHLSNSFWLEFVDDYLVR